MAAGLKPMRAAANNDSFDCAMTVCDFITEPFHEVALKGRPGGSQVWKQISIRQISVKGKSQCQVESIGERQSFSKNYEDSEALQVELRRLLADLGLWSSVTMRKPGSEISVQISKKGKAIVHQHKGPKSDDQFVKPPLVYVQPHDRVKAVPISPDVTHPFLIKLGMQTAEGKIKAGQSDKFRQINDFLRLLSRGSSGSVSLLDGLCDPSTPIRILDAGCGSSHLTFGSYHYVTNVLGRKAQIRGVDTNAELMAKSNDYVRELGLSQDDAQFITSPIGSYAPNEPPHLLIALHACDTATDDALALAVRVRHYFITLLLPI